MINPDAKPQPKIFRLVDAVYLGIGVLILLSATVPNSLLPYDLALGWSYFVYPALTVLWLVGSVVIATIRIRGLMRLGQKGKSMLSAYRLALIIPGIVILFPMVLWMLSSLFRL